MDCFVASLLAMTHTSLNVVPAKAGTYTPRPIVRECCWTTFAQHNVLWLWVPAFAGTTMWRHTPHSRGAMRPKFFEFSLPPNRGRRESRVSDAPAAARGV